MGKFDVQLFMISFYLKLYPILFFLLSSLYTSSVSSAQNRYIVVEKLGGKRIRLMEGDEFHFKLNGEKALFNDVVMGFGDSIIIISSGLRIPIKDISEVYLPRNSFTALRLGMQSVGIGFIVFPTLAYFTSKNKYSPKESIIIGVSMILSAQLVRLLPKWKKYKMYNKSRIWIVE